MNTDLVENMDELMENKTPSISALHQALADNRVNDVDKLSQDLIDYYKLVGAPQCLVDYVTRCEDKNPTRRDLETLITAKEETLSNIISVIGIISAYFIRLLYRNLPNLAIGLPESMTAGAVFPTELHLPRSWIQWIDGWCSSMNE